MITLNSGRIMGFVEVENLPKTYHRQMCGKLKTPFEVFWQSYISQISSLQLFVYLDFAMHKLYRIRLSRIFLSADSHKTSNMCCLPVKMAV